EQTQAESLASPTIEVSLSVPDATGSNTVNYTMTGTAVEGKDYTLANGTLTFVANDTSETIPLTIIDDALMENLETIIFTLTSPTGNAVLGSDIVHTYTITDNQTMTVELNGGDTSVTTSSSLVPSIDVYATGDLTPDTQAAYRGMVNGGDYIAANVPFNDGVSQANVVGTDGTLIGATDLTPANPAADCVVGTCLNFPGTASVYVNGGQLTTISNTFSYSFWVKPAATRNNTTQSTSGTAGTSGQRYLVMPIFAAAPNSGAGVSVGTNGVSVFEHAPGYVPSLLVHAATITDWTHVAVVYNNKTPSLYLNGVFAKTGLTSPRTEIGRAHV